MKLLIKFSIGIHNDYKKRVYHDIVLDKIRFQDKYGDLKEKHAKYWIDNWVEKTDPGKHVFEDIAIAAFLIGIWEEERQRNPSKMKQTFVDVGCGNGFLVHLLNQEGYTGYGVDISRRKSWTSFEGSDLRQECIIPSECVYDVDWVIGNHPDELTLWIPIIAARSNAR